MNQILTSVKEKASLVKQHMSGKMLTSGAVGTAMVLGTSLSTFASTPSDLPTIAITQDMLKPLVEGVVANITAVLPMGIALFSVFLGIRIIPAIFSRFSHM